MNIVKVISVIDTREYEEQGDSFVPIPGSGNPNVCSRCGREHEIHWTVQLEDGQNAIVGGSCAKSSSLDAKVVQSAERQASNLKRLSRELSTYEGRLAELERVIAEVAALPRPPFIEGELELSDGRKIPTIRAGDGEVVWCQFSTTQDPERQRCALRSWESKRIGERTKIQDSIYGLKDLISYTTKRLKTVRTKLSETI